MPQLTLPLHVLALAPRPTHLAQLPSRARVEAFYDALETLGDQVVMEWLWPATGQALLARLAQEGTPVATLYLDAVVAQDADGPAFWLEDGPLSAAQLGAWLREREVPLTLLSGWPADGQAAPAPELARRLVKGGVSHALAASPILGVDPFRQAVMALFSALATGHPVGQAVEDARRALANALHRGNALSPGEGLSLAQREDAPLVESVVASGVSKIVRFPAQGLLPAWQRLAVEPEAGGLPPEPVSGLVGRARELAQLEEALRGESNGAAHSQGNGIVVVHGYEGVGKTTLLAHLGRWLVRTGRFAQVVYTNFGGGGYPETALYDLGVRLLGDDFKPDTGDPVGAIEQALVETPTLILWDDLDALLEGGEFALETPVLSELLQLGARLARAGSSRLCVLLGPRALPDAAYHAPSAALELTLGGLAASDALEWWRVRVNDEKLPAKEALSLIRALNGHPLALAVLSPLLNEQPLSQVQAALEEILPGLMAGEAQLRNQALDVALEAFLRSFDLETREALLGLGVVVSGFMEPMVSTAVKFNKELWPGCKKRLQAAGLLREERIPGLTVSFVRLHPAWPLYLSRRLAATQRAVLEANYSGSYLGLLSWMSQNEKHSGEMISSLMRLELPNFRRGLRLLLGNERLTTAADYARYLDHFLDLLGFTYERQVIRAQMQKATEAALPAEGPLGRAGVQLLLSQSEQLFNAGRVGEAGTVLQKLLERMEQENGLAYSGEEAQRDQGIALHRLGRFWQVVGRADTAVPIYGRALSLLRALPATPSLQQELVGLYENLGEALMAMRQWDKAEEIYGHGLELAAVLKDQHKLGTLNAQLGVIAMTRQAPAQARQRFETALEYLKTTEDYAGMASIWNQLGGLARAADDLAEAEQDYRQALELIQKTELFSLQAQILMQLAQLVEQTERWREAEAYYAQVIRVCQQNKLNAGLVAAETALARLLLKQGQLQNARAHAEAARAVVEGAGRQANPWNVYLLLQQIAQAEGNPEREAHWQAKARESFAQSQEAQALLQPWQPIITGVARAGKGEALDAETVQLLENLEASDQWRGLVEVIWRILNGERGEELYTELDHVDAFIVKRILDAIAAPEPEEEEEQQSSRADEGEQSPNIPLPELMAAVAAALNGNPQAQRAVSAALNSMSQAQAPEGVRRFAMALVRILQGELDPSVLQGLPENVAAPLRTLLERLKANRA